MTFNNAKSLSLRQYIDIACILPTVQFSPLPKQETWLYDVKGPAKGNRPYTYYRMLPWEAFNRGLQGVGFWSYNDGGAINTEWNDNMPTKGSRYSVVYLGDGNALYSSRRWEAWSLGLEDVALLTQYAKKFGMQRARQLASDVLANRANDDSKADQTRQQLLKALSTP
jgi:hypothetical protein